MRPLLILSLLASCLIGCAQWEINAKRTIGVVAVAYNASHDAWAATDAEKMRVIVANAATKETALQQLAAWQTGPQAAVKRADATVGAALTTAYRMILLYDLKQASKLDTMKAIQQLVSQAEELLAVLNTYGVKLNLSLPGGL